MNKPTDITPQTAVFPYEESKRVIKI